MRGYFGLGQLSPSEKSDILDQHRTLYNGYQSMQPKVSNTQPLYVQDFAKDKNGVTMSNKGVVTHYTNFGINEQWQAAVGNAVIGYVANKAADKIVDTVSNSFQEETNEGDGESQMCEECGGQMTEGECMECGYNEGEMEEETGHLDDIYDVEDFDPTAGFDYIEGSSNDVDTFEGMHHMKEQDDDYVNYEDNLDEQGGNADDMDVDDVEPAYNFDSNGPMDGGDTYPVTEEGNMDEPEITYDAMESAFNDEEEMDEQDVSGVQGIYNDMKPAFDFDSEGAGKAGPYQHSQYEGEDDFDEDELEVNFDEFDPRDKSWEEITAHTGDDEFGGVDEDIKESLITQKNRIMEMMNRMKVIK